MLEAMCCPALRVQVWGCQFVSGGAPGLGPWLWLQRDKAHPLLAPGNVGNKAAGEEGSV